MAVLACNSDTLATSRWSSDVGHEHTSGPEYLHAIWELPQGASNFSAPPDSLAGAALTVEAKSLTLMTP
jgi:hypothetical protein